MRRTIAIEGTMAARERGDPNRERSRRNAELGHQIILLKRKLGLSETVTSAECEAARRTIDGLRRLSEHPLELRRAQDVVLEQRVAMIEFTRRTGLSWTPVLARLSKTARSKYRGRNQ